MAFQKNFLFFSKTAHQSVRRHFSRLLAVAITLVLPVHAETLGGLDFSGSGFLTLGAGKMLGGSATTPANYNCPCFISDFAQGGVYDGRGGVQWKPDSKLGLQGTVAVHDTGVSLTAQVVARSTPSAGVDFEWAYASYKLTDNTTIQLGRKRLPMFYYSDVQDIGFALPWTHLPSQVYGWEVVNYNGINLLHQTHLGEWSATLNLLAGSESQKDSGYWKIYSGKQNQTDVKWGNIVGGDVTVSNGPYEARLVYIQSNTKRQSINGVWNPALKTYAATTDPYLLGQVTQQKIYGAAFNVDKDSWLARSEFLFIDHPGATFQDFAQMLGLGRRFGSWQVMATVSRYYAKATNGGDPLAQEGHIDRAITVRYDLSPTSGVKVQFDSQKDQSGPRWATRFGDARLLTFTYDQVF